MRKFFRFFVRGGEAVVKAAQTPIGKSLLSDALAAVPFANVGMSIFTAIAQAEEKFGRGNGTAKLSDALDSLSVASPQIIRDFERQYGRELMDEERFRIGVQKMTEGQADIASAFGMMADEGKK